MSYFALGYGCGLLRVGSKASVSYAVIAGRVRTGWLPDTQSIAELLLAFASWSAA